MEKLGFSLQSSYALPMADVLHLLRDLGLYGISPVWQHGGDLDAIAELAAQCNLAIQSLHGPLRGIPALWREDHTHAIPLLEDFLHAVDDCVTYGIPVLVVHSWTGLDYTFRETELVFSHFDTLVDYAASHGVQIAFENLEGPEYLDALMAHYRHNAAVGFCWDSGHERCYTPTRDYLTEYGDRLLMTHLNDNLGITDPGGQLRGTDDLHLLPGDGTACWEQIVTKLTQARRQEILNFELKIRPKGDRCTHDLYSKLPLEQYLTKAYKAACAVTTPYFR